MSLFVDNRLWGTFVHVRVSLELESQVQAVDQKQDHTCATADGKDSCVGKRSTIVVERSVEGSLIILMVSFDRWQIQASARMTYRKQKTHHTQTEKTSAHLRDSVVVDLLSET